jgi:diaminopimelate epimerase
MRSSRWDAQGNVYLVTEESLTPDRVRVEVGETDGILEVFRSGDDWLEIAIWNPDGSRAERTGAETVTVRVGPRDVRAVMLDGPLVEQDMGEPVVGAAEEAAGIRFTPVDVGNPHAVVDGDPAELPRIGPLLEVHPRFPRRTNVQVAQATVPGEIVARVWERGAGETAASGSSAVAIAAAFGGETVRVRFPGGPLDVRFDGARAFLTGQAERID